MRRSPWSRGGDDEEAAVACRIPLPAYLCPCSTVLLFYSGWSRTAAEDLRGFNQDIVALNAVHGTATKPRSTASLVQRAVSGLSAGF